MNNSELNHLTDEALAVIAESNSDAMYVLIGRYTRLIRWKASQLCGAAEADDLVQEGFLGLLSAVAGFDEKRNVKFYTYASTCIVNRMLTLIRSSKCVPMPVGDTSAPEFEAEDTAAQPDSIVIQREEWTALWNDMVARLSHQEYQVCMMFMGGAGYAEISKALGITSKSVDNALQRARRKLRRGSVQ